MTSYPTLKPHKVIKALAKLGFEKIRQKGSHAHFKKEKRIVTVPIHNRDLKTGTLKSIINQAGVTIEELIKNS